MNGNAQNGCIGIGLVFFASLTVIVLWPWLGACLALSAIGLAIYLRERGKPKPQWIGLGIAGIVAVGLSFVSQSAKTDAAAEQQRQSDKEAADHRQLDRQEAAQQAAERKEAVQLAAQWGITLDQYERLQNERYGAHSTCQEAVKQQARWTAKNTPHGWLASPDFSWSAVDANRIRITAKDVRMTNGFGGATDVAYSCVYDVRSQQASVEPTN